MSASSLFSICDWYVWKSISRNGYDIILVNKMRDLIERISKSNKETWKNISYWMNLSYPILMQEKEDVRMHTDISLVCSSTVLQFVFDFIRFWNQGKKEKEINECYTWKIRCRRRKSIFKVNPHKHLVIAIVKVSNINKSLHILILAR